MSGAGEKFSENECGATLVEFAVVLSIFLLLVFGLIDFARLGFSSVMAEKATETAVRMAAVRPVVCPNVPRLTKRGIIGSLSVDMPNGTQCTARSGLCRDTGAQTCRGSLDDTTVAEVWAQIQPLLPVNATPENLEFTYHYDANLNRVGAPYAPIVTVALAELQFDFISPLGALAKLSGADGASGLGESFVFSSMSASLPAEDLE